MGKMFLFFFLIFFSPKLYGQSITEEEALKIASKHGCNKWQVKTTYDEVKVTWKVYSEKKRATFPQRTFRAKLKYRYIIIDASNGKIIEIKKKRFYKRITDWP